MIAKVTAGFKKPAPYLLITVVKYINVEYDNPSVMYLILLFFVEQKKEKKMIKNKEDVKVCVFS